MSHLGSDQDVASWMYYFSRFYRNTSTENWLSSGHDVLMNPSSAADSLIALAVIGSNVFFASSES